MSSANTRVNLGLNQANANRFVVSIPFVPVIKELWAIYDEDVMTFNVYEAETPGLKVGSIKVPFSGVNRTLAGNSSANDEFTITFDVDEELVNWGVFITWLEAMKNQADGTGFQFLGANGTTNNNKKVDESAFTGYVNISIAIFNSADKHTATCTLYGAHPSSVSGLKHTSRDGKTMLTASVTFSYDYQRYEFKRFQNKVSSVATP
jgi:hypothetical protein